MEEFKRWRSIEIGFLMIYLLFGVPTRPADETRLWTDSDIKVWLPRFNEGDDFIQLATIVGAQPIDTEGYVPECSVSFSTRTRSESPRCQQSGGR